jgi:hypothetical protein
MRALLLLLVPSLALADAPQVKLDAAAQTIVDAIGKIDLKHAKFGETLVIATIAPGDTTKPLDAKPLRDALANLKLNILDDRPAGNGVAIIVEGANGSRASIAVDQGGGSITLTARPRMTKLTGKCVVPPDVKHPVYVVSSGINNDGESSSGSSFWDIKTERIHDVDGDAIPDMFVPVAKAKNTCPEDVSYRVFVMRGDCGHDVGVIGPGSFQFDAGTAAIDGSGFRPFTMTAEKTRHGKKGIPESTTTTRRFAVQRGKYAVLDSKSSTGVCHHCATWSCNAP